MGRLTEVLADQAAQQAMPHSPDVVRCANPGLLHMVSSTHLNLQQSLELHNTADIHKGDGSILTLNHPVFLVLLLQQASWGRGPADHCGCCRGRRGERRRAVGRTAAGDIKSKPVQEPERSPVDDNQVADM